ncbi:MAG: ATP-binding protein [Desulfobacterales bacterium]|nr:ATP-binding protein [Desulfobacterales bacterium]
MLIKFSNLGAIKETELDLRPLTIIIGPNNSNKTYIAYSVYALWEWMRGYSLFDMTFEQREENCWSLPIDDFIDSFHKNYTTKKSKLDLENFFQDSSHELFSKTIIDFKLLYEDIREASKKIGSGYYVLTQQGGSFDFKIDKEALLIRADKPTISSIDIIHDCLSFLVRYLLFPTPLPLPAERNALVLTYKLLSDRRYKLLKDSHRQLSGDNNLEIGFLKKSIGYPKPMEDFLDFLTDVEMAKDFDPNQKNDFQKLADDIEQHIQNKNKIYLENMKLSSKEIKVKVKRGLNIDLHNASSSIRQLAPLLLYLRYRAKENDLLIIDEPELNLHPESQAKLLEAFGIMVNLGIKVLITTHSPYLLAHLNNLVSGDMKDPEMLRNQATSLYLKDSRAFVSMDQVSAYEMKKNKLHSLKDEEYGIRWDTLSDVSSDIQQKYFEIHEKKEASSNGEKE